MTDPRPDRAGVDRRPRLSSDERRRLLAEIERTAGPAPTAETLLERARQALQRGELEQVRRLVAALEASAPASPGLAWLKETLVDAERRAKRQSNLRAAEEMLERYIQQRKKTLALLALETLIELAPDHPRRSDYQTWVADIDQEVRIQARVDAEIDAGRSALQGGDLTLARRRLETLTKLDPHSRATERFAEEVAQEARQQAEGASIEQRKARIETLLGAGEVDGAEAEIAALAELDLPKVTLDFLRKRLEDTRASLRSEAELLTLQSVFEQHLERGDWPAARDVATAVARQLRDHPRVAEMFNRVSRLEAEHRRRQSIEQGIATLEGFIAHGRRAEAELALKVLRGLDIDDGTLRLFQQRIARL